MTKDETVKYLRGIKIPAELIKGVVVIYTDQPMSPGEKERIRNILRSISYRGSWGWRQRGVSK